MGAEENDIELLECVCVCDRARQRQEWCLLLLVKSVRVVVCGQRNKVCMHVAERLADIWNMFLKQCWIFWGMVTLKEEQRIFHKRTCSKSNLNGN